MEKCLKLQRKAKTWTRCGRSTAFSVIQRLLPPSIPIHVCRNWMRLRREEKRREEKRREEKRREEKRREGKGRKEKKREEKKWSLRLNLTQHGKAHQVPTQ